MKLKKQNGFTLVELVVVMVIIGILAAVLIPGVSGYIAKAKQNANYQEAMVYKRTIDNAILENTLIDVTTNGTSSKLRVTSYDSFVTTANKTVNMANFFTAYLGSFPSDKDVIIVKENDKCILQYSARQIVTKIDLETGNLIS